MGQFVEIYIDSNNRLRQEKNVILSFLIALRNYKRNESSKYLYLLERLNVGKENV
jgi:hypothetical protein